MLGGWNNLRWRTIILGSVGLGVIAVFSGLIWQDSSDQPVTNLLVALCFVAPFIVTRWWLDRHFSTPEQARWVLTVSGIAALGTAVSMDILSPAVIPMLALAVCAAVLIVSWLMCSQYRR